MMFNLDEQALLETTLATDWAHGIDVDQAMLNQAAEIGLTAIQVAANLGGKGFSFACKTRACEILAAVDFGFAMSMVNSHNVAHKISEFAAESVKRRCLPPLLSGQASGCTALTEPGTGSDFFAIKTSARQAGDDWILNGEKTWITNAAHASYAVTYVQTGERGDRHGIAAFVVDLKAPGCEAYALDNATAQASGGVGGFKLTNYRASKETLLLPPGEAFRSVLSEINGARTYVAAMCCGMLDRGLQEVTSYGKTRETFGKPLSQHQAWRFTVAQAETELAAARHLVDASIKTITEGQDAQVLSAQAKIFAVDVCQRHLPKLMHAMGAEGLSERYCFSRHLLATGAASLTDGSTEMLLERVAQLARP